MYTHKIPCKPRPRALYFVNPRSVNVTKVRGLVQSYTTSPEVQLSDERRSDFDGDQMQCGKN